MGDLVLAAFIAALEPVQRVVPGVGALYLPIIDAFFDLAHAIITVRSLIRKAWTLYRWDTRPARRP
jgi:hypothetical protein